MNTQVAQARRFKIDRYKTLTSVSTRSLLAKAKAWRGRARQRRQLAQLPPEMLKDIGVSRTDALREAQKPFWKC